MDDMINISLGNAAITALLGYLVVFAGLVLLMLVVMALGGIMKRSAKPASASASVAAPVQNSVILSAADGSAGELKLYDTDPRDAAMCMAIVADALGKPLNELRFISIKEVKER